jgi:hypothetical protein
VFDSDVFFIRDEAFTIFPWSTRWDMRHVLTHNASQTYRDSPHYGAAEMKKVTA